MDLNDQLDKLRAQFGVADFTVEDSGDDDVVLITPAGDIVDTWRENYPYDERMDRADYEYQKRLLQIELLKLQNWIKATGLREFDGWPRPRFAA